MTYRVYVTECFAGLMNWDGKHQIPKYFEFINRKKKPVETRSGDEIKNELVAKLNSFAEG